VAGQTASRDARRLRARQAEAALVAALADRPARAESWLLLAWTRLEQGDAASARALAGYATTLDPRRRELVEAAGQLQAAAR
jgi:cytochrome c-type biogenesis protein CcmH/NrfG